MHEENFLRSWLTEDVAMLTEEMEEVRMEHKEEKSKRRNRGVERERERVEVNIKSFCFDRSARPNSHSACFEVFSCSEFWNAGSMGFLSECVFVGVFDLPVSSDHDGFL